MDRRGTWVGQGAGSPAGTSKRGSEWREYPFPLGAASHKTSGRPTSDKNGNITAIAESTQTHQKLIVHFDGRRWTINPPRPRAPLRVARYRWHVLGGQSQHSVPGPSLGQVK